MVFISIVIWDIKNIRIGVMLLSWLFNHIFEYFPDHQLYLNSPLMPGDN